MGRFMSQQSLSSFIWSVADLLRGDYKQSDYGTSFETGELAQVGFRESLRHSCFPFILMGCRNGGLDAGESSLAEKRRAKPLAVMEGTAHGA